MRRLWLFNPENDLALAAGTANFTAPEAAVELGSAGALLPFFLAADDDFVYVAGVNAEWFDSFRRQFGLRAELWPHTAEGCRPEPWGWSEAARRRFEHLGFADDTLPSKAMLARWRELSHRRTAAELGARIAACYDLPLWPAAVEVSDAAALKEAVEAFGTAVVKQPWSSSGRGVRRVDSSQTNLSAVIDQLGGSMRRQGSLLVEKYMAGHHDFALLYMCQQGRTEFCGPSLFFAAENGQYSGNLVAPDPALFSRISLLLPSAALGQLIDAVTEGLSSIVAPDYSGPVGVDICCNDLGYIHICELNLRYTMGFVARGIARRTERPFVLSLAKSTLPDDIILTPPGPLSKFILRKTEEGR